MLGGGIKKKARLLTDSSGKKISARGRETKTMPKKERALNKQTAHAMLCYARAEMQIFTPSFRPFQHAYDLEDPSPRQRQFGFWPVP